MTTWRKFSAEQPPKPEPFLYGYKADGKWRIGLAYWTVSGTWRGEYNRVQEIATHWKLIGPNPDEE